MAADVGAYRDLLFRCGERGRENQRLAELFAELFAGFFDDWKPVTEGHAARPWVYFANRFCEIGVFVRVPMKTANANDPCTAGLPGGG